MRKIIMTIMMSVSLLLAGLTLASPAQAVATNESAISNSAQTNWDGIPVKIVPNTQAAKILYPYGCPTGSGNNGWFCLYGDITFGHINTRYPSSITRNQCNTYVGHGDIPAGGPPNYTPALPATWTYAVVNTTGVSWRVHRTITCGGSSLTVPGHSSLLLGTGWAAVIDFAFQRTATVS
jgi:hypothetical protein